MDSFPLLVKGDNCPRSDNPLGSLGIRRKKRTSLPLMSPNDHEGKGEHHYKWVLNYYSNYLTTGLQEKQREVNVEFYRLQPSPEKYCIKIWRDRTLSVSSQGEEVVAKFTLTSQNFCGAQTWGFTKKSGIRKRMVNKKYLNVLLDETTHVFQQMKRDCDNRIDFLDEFQDALKRHLGIEKWWKCMTCYSSDEEQNSMTLHLTNHALSMVNGKVSTPSCMKMWPISDIKDCGIISGDKFFIEFQSGCQLKGSTVSKGDGKEIVDKIKNSVTAARLATRKIVRSTTLDMCLDVSKILSKAKIYPTLPPSWKENQAGMKETNGQELIPQELQVNGLADSMNDLSLNACTKVSVLQRKNGFISRKDLARKASSHLVQKRETVVRRRSFCTSNYVEETWEGTALAKDMRKSSSNHDLSDERIILGNTDQQGLKKKHSHVKRSTVRKQLNKMARRDQVSSRLSCIQPEDEAMQSATAKESAGITTSIWEFQPYKPVSDVVYTLKRIMDRQHATDTLGIPWGLYHTICFKLMPKYPGVLAGNTMDWRYLAELIGFNMEDIHMMESFHFQTPIITPQDILLKCWQDRHNRWQGFCKPECSIRNLVKFLKMMDRHDILEDIENSKKKIKDEGT